MKQANLEELTPGGDEESEILTFLCEQVAKLTGLPESAIDVARPVTALGLDSLGAVELSHCLEERFGQLPPLADLLEGPSLTEVAGWFLKPSAAPADLADRLAPAGKEEEEGEQPLSYGQRALWFLHQLAPEDAAYNVTAALAIRGPLDVDTLEQAAALVIRRHTSLRSSFHPGPEGPVRRVHRERGAFVLTLDATAWSADELAERLHREAWRPFDLAADPLLRLAVFRRSADEHVLLIAVHHIVSDLWSLAVLKRDLDAAYRVLRGDAVELAAAPRLCYADYVRWQNRRLASPEGERLWEAWRERLAGELPETTLPPDRPRGVPAAARGGSLTAWLEAAACADLRRLAQAGSTTLSTALLSGFLGLLQRYTGQEDLLVGLPTDGRDRPELADLVGYLVNPVVVRADLAGDPTPAALLARVRAASLFALAHREMPFPLLVERLQPVRDASRSPLFQTLFVFQRSPAGTADDLGSFALGAAGATTELAGMPAASVALESRAVRFDLELVTAELGSRVGLSLRYDAGRFEPATMERLLGHLKNLLAALAAAPGEPLSALPMLSAADRRQLLVDLNRTGEVTADGATLHGLFFEQARRTPEMPAVLAVLAGGAPSTYGELAERVARLAGLLRAAGLSPEEPVAVCLSRGVHLVEALLGVMAAGGAYVPIDPRYPRERQAYLLADSGARLLLTEAGLAEGLTGGARRILVEAWQDGPAISAISAMWAMPAMSAIEPPPRSLPAGLAYLIYTSGSTGRPKGVAIEHRSAAALVRWALAAFPPAVLARTVASTSVCFDLSVFELFVPLAGGGTVVLVDDALAVPAAAPAEPTLLNTVPSALAELLRQGALPPSVATVNLAGEPLSRALVEEAYRTGTVERVYNLYGPSEDTTYSTWALVPPGAGAPVTIGRPLPGTRAYVLDARGLPVPFGAIGELHLAGAGLARGYFHRPELTAERFVPDPFAPLPGGRLYRTGDRVRYRPDGELEFLGRVDQQVKVRGFRVEPGEVEAALTAAAAVREALVTTCELRPGDLQLVAYAVPAPGSRATAESLRALLAARLPEFMIPTLWVLLPALPRTPNGKVDRRALPAPEVQAGAAGAAPRGELEELLAGLFADLLKVEQVGRDDSFFALGGHSLLATQLVSRIRQALGAELSVQTVFAAPTVAALAGLPEISARSAGSAGTALPPIERSPRSGPLPLSFAQSRLWFLHRLAPGSPSYNMPCAVRLAGPLEPSALAAAFAEIVRRHEVLRTAFPLLDGQPAQSIAPSPGPGALLLPRVDLSGLPAGRRAAEEERLTSREARRPFDLGRGPVLRCLLIVGSAAEHALLVTLHHIAADGWSIGILARELSILYRAGAARQPSPLPELPLQYADFAGWQRRFLSGEVLTTQLAYWRQQLAGLPDGLDLPLDRPRPALPTLDGGRAARAFPDALRLAIHRRCREQGATFFMLALAAFAALLARLTRQTDLVVGAPIANRTHREIEDLIGFFVNTLVLRLDAAGAPAFGELLGRAREAALGAGAHQDLPFERLVEELAPERSLDRTPLFQVVCVVQNAPPPVLDLPGLSTAVRPVHAGTANFDLTLTFAETDGILEASLEYKTALFDAGTVERFLDHLVTLTDAAVADPGTPVSRLPLLDATERHQLVAEPLAGVRPFPADLPLHRRFERQVTRTPAAVAVTGEGGALTYAELDRRAGRLAARLLRLGVGPEVRVALWLDRTVELVVAVLGVLKAGGAYVPIDPSYPEDRLRFLLADAGAPVLVSVGGVGGLGDRLERAGAGVATVLLDRLDESAAPPPLAPDLPPAPPPDLPESTAYVIYTSGSTGRPKGVPVHHTNVVRLFTATAAWFGFGERDVWTLFHSYAFDFSVWELWGALLHGGRLVVVPYWVSRSPEAFYDLLAREQVTVLNQTPSAFHQLTAVEDGWEGERRESALALSWVIFGGEALEPRRLAGWCARHGDRPTLVNMYGITETTVHVTFRPLGQGDLERGSVIGAPIPDLYLHLLDGEREPVPLGIPGEIHVGGAGLARGYLNRPDLTAERFVPDPFADLAGVPGARLYASGDLARRRPDGELEYLGRADQQVKIRGFRIEPGEIEAALAEHPAVREAVVLARDGQEGRRLVAWLGVGDGSAPGADELRSFLRSRLPEHMIPAVFVPLTTLPLTVHGKVDRRALPEPAALRPQMGEAYVAPRDPDEAALAEVWAEVLELDRVGIHDNFFALGGDSIRSVRLVALAEARGLCFALPQLFRHQTIAELAPHRQTPAAPKAAPAPFALVTAAERATLAEDVEDAYPLSALQLGMLFHSEFGEGGEGGGTSLYHNVSTVRLSRALDPEALRGAAAQLARRHPVLRTSFDPVGAGRPLQRVHRAVVVPVTAEDLSGLPPAEQEAAVARRFAAEKADHFDWGRPPLLRFHLQRLGGSATQFFWTEHHVIVDGWSLAVLLAELFELYEAELAGTPPPPPLVTTFREFIAREREVLESEAARDFWTDRLRDAAPARLLPWHPAEENQDRAPVLAPLPDAVLAGLRELAAGSSVPLKSVFLAAHVWVVGRIAGTRDVVTGLVTNGRPEAADADRVLGLFLNSVPLRAPLAGGTWRDLARQMFVAEREILPFRLYPLPEIQRELGATQLFETSFNYVNFYVLQHAEEAYGLALDRMQVFSETSIPLALDVVQGAARDSALLSLQRDPAAVNQDQLRAIVDLYLRVLAAMAEGAAAPGARYDLADLLSPAERQQIVAEWNDTALVTHLPSELVHEVFAGWAARTPEAPALLSAGGQLTYRELNRRANRIARRLLAAGAGPEVAVGLYVERSPEMIAGVLGILKAGAAYVPLDPAYPQERLLLMIEDVRMPLILAQERLAEGVAGLTGSVIALDRLGESGPEDDANPPSAVTADNLAYAIFTSGSTGRPKPVGVSHRALTHHMAGTRQVLRMAEHEDDRVLQFSTLNFDGSVDQIFIALVNGGCLGLREEEMWSAEELEARIGRMGLTIIDLPTGYWSEWVRARSALAPREGGETLRVVYVGGEAMLSEELAVWWRSPRNRTVRLLNAYGPTETVVAASFLEATSRESAGPLFERVAIGWPLGGRALHVVDGEGRLAPVGVPGELLIAGEPILARGYLGRPELTAERFLPDAFATRPGSRLYRTGDLGRYLPDGRREFLGRVDDQVKVRGFRIELGEVEAALAEHPAVHRAAAVVHGAGRNHRLVAYFTPIADLPEPPKAAELRAFLQGKLPEPMVPSDVVLLDRLPLTPNGKVDRRALPVPELVRPALGVEYAAPRTPEEEAVAAVWAEVLELDRVGVHDSFFDLGGDSIRSIRFLSLAATRGLRFSLADLFQYPTIADLVPHRLESSEGVANASEAGPSAPLSLLTAEERAALPDDVEDAYPVSTLQLGMLFHSGFSERGERSSAYHNVFSLRLSRPIDAVAFAAAAGQLALRHPVLRTAFDLGGFRRPLQLVRRAVEIPVTAEDLAGLPPVEREAAVARRLDEERAHLFAPDQAPLLRFHIQHLGGAETQLFWTGHHVILDGWSAAVLLAELFQLYQAEREGTPAISPPPLPPVTTFRDFIALERAVLESAEAREFWEDRLRDVDPPRLLLWHPDEENRDRTPLNVPLPGLVLAGLRELAAAAGIPLKNVFLAAHVWVVGRMTGTRDVVTGLVTNGRPEAADADRVLGLFLNTVPLRTALAGGTWRDLARQMFVAEREILPFRRFPLSEIQRQLGIARLFETSFNFVNFYVAAAAQQASGLQLDKFRFVGETSIPLAVDFSQDTVADVVRLNAQRDPAVVNQDQLRAIVELYLRVLSAMAEAPGERYDLADLLGPAERQQLTAEWNDTALVAHLPSELVHEVFAGWAARTPEAPALRSAGGLVSYRELNRRANRIARRLLAAGAGPEVAVGLYVERSPEMIAGVLGILKAGAAYVPLDPAYPQERLLLMIEDVRMPLILSQERLAGGVAGLTGSVIALDRLGESGPEDDANPPRAATADNLAYAIFTSGSTGRPKPVGVSHRALTHHMAGTRQVLRMAEHENDRVLQFSTLNFDGSVDQIFIALVNGGCLGLREEEMWSAEELEARIGEMGLTIIDLPTGYWSEWVRARSALAPREGGETLRVVYVGGEAMLSEELAVWWRSPRNRTVRLLNAYGPTETVVAASFLEATSRESAGPLFERVAIGWPLGGRALHVVDPEGRLSPVGVAGELLIAGEPILARGYLGRPELTAERFLPDPFATRPGSRLYRTGDLGRYLPDGRREFLGRVDDQVKVRGFRIELGEVEAALAEHPAVHRAAAVVHDKGGPSQRRLVAYVALVNHGAPATSAATAGMAAELRAFLRGKLPEPMVPSEVVILERLPLTANGKVDRRALPAPELSARRDGAPVPAPRNAIELQLAGIWEELLEVSPIGVTDNFLELGGHSLLAVRLMARIERVFGVQLPISALFEAPTVESLAALLQGREAPLSRSPLVRLHPGGAGRPLYVVHPVGGDVFAYVELAKQLGAERPVYGLQAVVGNGNGAHSPTSPSMEELAAQYLAAVREIQAEGPYLLAGWSLGAVIAYEMAQQIERSGDRVALLAMIDPSTPADGQAEGTDDASLLAGFAFDLVRLSGRPVPVGPEVLAGLDVDSGLDRLVELGRAAGVLPPDVDRPRLRERFDLFSRNVKALEGYAPRPYGGRVALFRASASLAPGVTDPAFGWSALADAEAHVLDADHYSVLQRPALDGLVERLGSALARVEGEGGVAPTTPGPLAGSSSPLAEGVE
jgi:amino acid adenylation domain-containing protein